METIFKVDKEIDGRYFRLRVYQDDDYPFDPREWDNLGHMVCFHRNYNLGDKHDFADPEEFMEYLTREDKKNNIIARPLYLFDHSGITMNTGGFYHCDPQGWDWGKVGYIYVTKEEVRKEFNVKQVHPALREKVLNILQGEVEEYDTWLRGEIYGYMIEELVSCDCCGHTEEVHIDGCGGFFGWDLENNGMLSEIPEEWHELIRQEV